MSKESTTTSFLHRTQHSFHGRSANAKGQGMTEYIVVLALVVVAAIGVYSFFGKTVRNQMAGVAQEISGQSSTTQVRDAGTAADNAATRANQDYSLSNYDEATNSGG